MAYFPLFVDLQGRKCVVIGGGRVAFRKAAQLKKFGGDIYVISPRVCENIKRIGIKYEEREPDISDTDDAFLVICASDNREVNNAFASAAKEKGIFCDTADNGVEGSFLFPSIIMNNDITVGICTGGKAPSLSKYIRRMVEPIIGDIPQDAAKSLSSIRERIKQSELPKEERKRIMADMTEFFVSGKSLIRIGTRKSLLAVRQGEMIGELIKSKFGMGYEIITMNTEGDRILDKALTEFGGKGVFVTEFENALRDGRIDIAVHSAKDLPTDMPKDLEIAGIPKRDDPFDVLVTIHGRSIGSDEKAVIGTSSERRKLLVKKEYPMADIKLLRGNINTRLKKLADGEYDGIILAKAGLDRLGISEEDTYTFTELKSFIPSGNQGILAAQCVKDGVVSGVLRAISDPDTQKAFYAEREFLHRLGIGCHEPAGVYAEVSGENVKISAFFKNSGICVKTGAYTDIDKIIDDIVKEVSQ